MQVCELREILGMYPNDAYIHIRTTPDDLTQPLTKKAIGLIPASHSERYGLQREILLLTAYFPEVKS